MVFHPEVKREAILLRRAGCSYGEILKKLGIRSKGTLVLWFRDIKLSKKSLSLLSANNEKIQTKRLHAFNNDRSQRIKSENENYHAEGSEFVKRISDRELRLIAASLYWAEGGKSFIGSPGLNFSNSDPRMIELFVLFLRKIACVSEEKIRAGIHLYEGFDIEKTKLFWSKITKLPLDRFYIVKQVSRASKGKQGKRKLPYGTAVIKVNNRALYFKIQGIINGISEATKISQKAHK